MTLARLEVEMSQEEFELWMAEDAIRADECPYCGVEPRDLMDFEQSEIKCPVCKQKYHKTKRVTPWPSLHQPVPLEASQAAQH
jgi:DNA-directed RNA polymerase subunit RPC12/RpoP